MDLSIPNLTSWTLYEKGLYALFTFVCRRPRFAVGSMGLCMALPFLVFGSKAILYGAACCCFGGFAIPGLIWCSLALAWFPMPRGPYSVGSCDIQIPIRFNASKNAPTLCARLFYPCSSKSKQRHRWLPGPVDAYCKAMGSIYGLPQAMSALLLYPARFIVTRAWKDAPLLEGSWSVVLFSHGLCGTRTMYSALCIELASHGYFVVAPEHTDGSAYLSITNGITVQYIARDQADRTQQLRQRVSELESCWKALPELAINFSNSLDLSSCILMGHSFGGATVACAASANSFCNQCSLVLLDPWVGPALGVFQSVQASAITIMQGSSMLWPGSASDVVQLLSSLDSKENPAFLTEVQGARHQDASDVPFFLHVPMALLCASSMTRSAQWVWHRNSEVIQQFLSFATEDEATKLKRLAAVSGVRVHNWKEWLPNRKGQREEAIQTMSENAVGA